MLLSADWCCESRLGAGERGGARSQPGPWRRTALHGGVPFSSGLCLASEDAVPGWRTTRRIVCSSSATRPCVSQHHAYPRPVWPRGRGIDVLPPDPCRRPVPCSVRPMILLFTPLATSAPRPPAPRRSLTSNASFSSRSGSPSSTLSGGGGRRAPDARGARPGPRRGSASSPSRARDPPSRPSPGPPRSRALDSADDAGDGLSAGPSRSESATATSSRSPTSRSPTTSGSLSRPSLRPATSSSSGTTATPASTGRR